MKKIFVFDGVAKPLRLRSTRGDTGRFIFSLWFLDDDGCPVEPYDLTGYDFAMQVRESAGSDVLLITVPDTAFSISQSQDAADWEEEHEDVQERQDMLTVRIPKELTKIDQGEWWYDIEFFPPDVDPEEKYTYIRGPYYVEQDTTLPSE